MGNGIWKGCRLGCTKQMTLRVKNGFKVYGLIWRCWSLYDGHVGVLREDWPEFGYNFRIPCLHKEQLCCQLHDAPSSCHGGKTCVRSTKLGAPAKLKILWQLLYWEERLNNALGASEIKGSVMPQLPMCLFWNLCPVQEHMDLSVQFLTHGQWGLASSLCASLLLFSVPICDLLGRAGSPRVFPWGTIAHPWIRCLLLPVIAWGLSSAKP